MAFFMICCFSGTVFADFGPGDTSGTAASSGETGTVNVNANVSRPVFPEPAPAVTDAEIAERLGGSLTGSITDQIILCIDHNLMLWDKQTDGSWKKSLDFYCGYGRNGLRRFDQRKEGDGTTPIGSFPILHAFGFGENPGTAMTWRPITENSYWSAEEATYNTWVESIVPVAGEHLSEYTICYRQALAMGFNTDPVVYQRGSALFIHIKNPETWKSAGCISLEPEDMNALLLSVHDGCWSIVVPDIRSVSDF